MSELKVKSVGFLDCGLQNYCLAVYKFIAVFPSFLSITISQSLPSFLYSK